MKLLQMKNNGFTILEFIIVLSILVLFSLLLLPNIVKITNKGRIEEDTKQLANAIRHNQYLAKFKGEEIRFSYEVGEKHYLFQSSFSSTSYKLTSSVFISENNFPLVLYPNGWCQSKKIMLGLDKYVGYVIIKGGTGKVEWKVEKINL